MKACPASIEPQRDESLLGYLRRIGKSQAYRETSEFLANLGFRYGRPLVESLPEIAKILNVPLEQMNSIAPSKNAAQPALVWKFDRYHSDPFCPECLALGGHFQQHWRHALVSACHVHRLRLQDVCPACKGNLSPRTGGFDHCSCGFFLKDFLREEAQPHEVTVARLIAGSSEKEAWTVPAALQTAPPANIGTFIHFLASGFADNRTGKEGKTAAPKSVKETVAFLRPIAPLISHWPEGFSRHVEERLSRTNGETGSAPAILGNWYQRLMQFREPAYRPYHEVVAQVVERCFEGSYGGALTSAEHRTWLSAKQAASEIGISSQRLVAAVLKKEVHGKVATSGYGHRHTIVPAAQVRKVASDRDRYWDGRKARDFLGLSRRQFDFLKEMNLIEEEASATRPPLTDGGFDRRRLESLVTNIRKNAKCRPGQTTAFSELTLRRTTDRAALEQVFRRIFDGEIRAAKANSDMRLGEFEFPLSEIKTELRRGRHSVDWTPQDVADITGWKSQSIVNWCRLGLLGAREVQHGSNAGYLITPEQLARFQSEYVPVASLANARGTTSRKLLAEFEKRGIATYGSKQEGATTRGHLIRIADVVFI